LSLIVLAFYFRFTDFSFFTLKNFRIAISQRINSLAGRQQSKDLSVVGMEKLSVVGSAIAFAKIIKLVLTNDH
jgi:hypothetical protein